MNRHFNIRIGSLIIYQSSERILCEITSIFQIPFRDLRLFRMRRQPLTSMSQELLYLIISDPVMLLIIQHWDQHIEVSQQFLQTNFST